MIQWTLKVFSGPWIGSIDNTSELSKPPEHGAYIMLRPWVNKGWPFPCPGYGGGKLGVASCLVSPSPQIQEKERENLETTLDPSRLDQPCNHHLK